MLDQLIKILKQFRAATRDNEAEEIDETIKQAKCLNKFTSIYLRHEFYGRLQKSATDGYCCMEHALGIKCNHKHNFCDDKKFALALSNHILIGKSVDMVSNFVASKKNLSSKKIFAELKGEFDEMKELTKLIRLEVLHFSKHTL